MATSVTGCANTKYAMTANGNEIKAGIYISYLQDELITQVNQLYYKGITDDYFSQQVDGVNLADHVKNTALKNTKEYYAIKKQFEDEGLSFTDEEIKSLNSSLNDSWENSGELFEEIGVSKESYKEIYRDYLRRSKLFSYYYGEDGSKAPTTDEMVKYINDNYLRYKMMVFYKSSNEDEAAAKEENSKAQEKRDKYYEIGKNYSFAEFDKLIEQRTEDEQAESEAAAEAENSSEDESTADSSVSDSSADESAADTSSMDESSADESSDDASVDESSDASSITDTDSSSGEVSEVESSTADSDSSESAADESASGTDSSEDESSEEESEAADPYGNEAMINFGEMKEDELSTPSGELYKKISEETVGKVFTFESDYGYYIVIKGDITERSAEYLEDNRSTILEEMKTDEFNELIQSWVDDIDFKVNEKAISRYSPETIYKRITDYYDEKNKTTTSAANQ